MSLSYRVPENQPDGLALPFRQPASAAGISGLLVVEHSVRGPLSNKRREFLHNSIRLFCCFWAQLCMDEPVFIASCATLSDRFLREHLDSLMA